MFFPSPGSSCCGAGGSSENNAGGDGASDFKRTTLERHFIPYVGLESVLQGFTGNVLFMKMKQERYENQRVFRVFTRAIHKVEAICQFLATFK